jgi:hypothetical protein
MSRCMDSGSVMRSYQEKPEYTEAVHLSATMSVEAALRRSSAEGRVSSGPWTPLQIRQKAPRRETGRACVIVVVTLDCKLQ